MSFDLAVWEGERPESNAAAAEVFVGLRERLEADELPAAPRIRAYVDALLERWPDITEDGGEDSPWADGPLISNARGDFFYFSLVWSMAEEAAPFAAALAAEHGLVCFDPQSELLLPEAEAPRRRSFFRRR